MSPSGREYLQHILDEVDFLLEMSRPLTRETFLRDGTLKRASVRSLEIIGEAVKRLPSSQRTPSEEIDWKGMAGMRDRLIHSYFGVDYELVWDVMTTKIPPLRGAIQELLARIPDTPP